jgi:outer membrane protein TolC
MHRHLRFLVLSSLLAGLTSLLVAQSSPATTPSLPEDYFPGLKTILESAVQQSPRMMSHNANVAIAEQNRIAARSGMLPSAGFSTSYYPWDRQERADRQSPDNPSGASNTQRFSYYLTVTQPVFHWGALKNTTRIGELQLKIAQGLNSEGYRLLVEEIRTQYLGVIIKKSALHRAQASQKMADDNLGLARSKLEKHVIADADMFNPTIAAEQARLATDRAASDYEDSRIYLGKLYGSGPLPDEQVPAEIPAIVPAASSLTGLYPELSGSTEFTTYSLENAKRGIEVEALNYKVASTRLLPMFNVVVGTSQDQQSYSVNPGARYQVRDYYAGGTISWALFDGFSTHAAKAASLIRRRELERAYADQTADMQASIRKQLRDLEYSSRNLAIVEKLLGSSNQYVDIKKDDVGRGLASDTDVQAAQLGAQDSRLIAYGARAEYLMKVAELLSTIQKDPALANLPIQHR